MNIGFSGDSAERYDLLLTSVKDLSRVDFNILSSREIPVVAFGRPNLLRTAFMAGCSDYIAVPLDAEELYFRIIKSTSRDYSELQWRGLKISASGMFNGSRRITVNYQQFLILKLLLNNRNTPIPRETFHYVLWGKIRTGSRDIDMNISIIRKKLKVFKDLSLDIKTVRGFGYMIQDSDCG